MTAKESMDNAHIQNALTRLFDEEGERIVFWNDAEKEFINVLPFLYLPDGIRILRLDQVGALEAKVLMEREEPEGRFLVYTPAEEPEYDADWLLDIRLYSRSFRADRASIVLEQLGLPNQYLRDHLSERRKFFDSKHRIEKLKPLVSGDDTDVDLDRKMIAVVVKADQPEWFCILRTLYHEFTAGGDGVNLDEPPEAWMQVEKYNLDEPFWHMAKAQFGYQEDNPSLRNLLIRLLVTDFAHHLKGHLPDSLTHLVLPPAGKSNAVVCLGQWRDSTSKGSSYDQLSDRVAGLLNIEDRMYELEIEDLLDVMTFQFVEKAIAAGLRDRIAGAPDTVSVEDIRSIAVHRQAGHWASSSILPSSQTPREAFHSVYDALIAAAEFFALQNDVRDGFNYEHMEAIYRAYEKDLYRFDQLYRHFCEHADIAEAKIWDILKGLRSEVEASYVNGYVKRLVERWGVFLEQEGPSSALSKWRIEGIPNQQRFFEKHVKPRLEEAERRRSFVIISDGLRYEAAEELARELNGKYRFKAQLSSQLGVLPSYTALGMASLLPHDTLQFKENGDVQVDGQPTASLEQRGQVLARVEGLAVKAGKLLEMKKEEGREFVKDARVVYIYHDVIDSTGDSAATEDRTFEAVRRALQEIEAIVAYVINNLNGHHVIVTADHGFFFAESAPGEPDKSSISTKPPSTVKATKRYLLGRDLGAQDGVWYGSTEVTAGAKGGMEFWLPRGINRFHFVGGARYVHGGAMPQEIVVPVVTVRHVKGKAVGSTKTKTVTVHVLGAHHKITTSRYRFELIQMEPVSERVKPVTLKVAVCDGSDPVTNIESVSFESASESMAERKKDVTLVLEAREYDKKKTYRLVLRDAETGVEKESVDVTIDRAFSDDF